MFLTGCLVLLQIQNSSYTPKKIILEDRTQACYALLLFNSQCLNDLNMWFQVILHMFWPCKGKGAAVIDALDLSATLTFLSPGLCLLFHPAMLWRPSDNSLQTADGFSLTCMCLCLEWTRYWNLLLSYSLCIFLNCEPRPMMLFYVATNFLNLNLWELINFLVMADWTQIKH